LWGISQPSTPLRKVAQLNALAPLDAGQALRRRSVTPIGPHVRADHTALGTHRPPVQVQEHSIVRPTVGVDNCAVMAESSGTIDQQPSNAVRADMPECHGRPSIGRGSSIGRWIVVGVAVAHQARFLSAPRRFTDAAGSRFGIPRMNRSTSAIASRRNFRATTCSLSRN
jgi:hypothetical protein